MFFNSRFLNGLCSNDTNIWKLSIINRIVWVKSKQFLGLAFEKSKNIFVVFESFQNIFFQLNSDFSLMTLFLILLSLRLIIWESVCNLVWNLYAGLLIIEVYRYNSRSLLSSKMVSSLVNNLSELLDVAAICK